MITVILSFLVFIFVQGCAVCDDLYPISVLRDLGITENQVEGSSDTKVPLSPRVLSTKAYARTDPFIKWIQKNIVEHYKFIEDPGENKWKKGGQPDFKEHLGTPGFKNAANNVALFFAKNNDWGTTKGNYECIDLLYLTAARYLLVTQILYEESGSRLIPCSGLQGNRLAIPAVNGVCYPAPYGSATCTSDYDVGLIGKNAGFITKKFNDRFQREFGRPSELVFDTNVYAFTLEYAMPFLFEGLPKNFVDRVTQLEKTVNFKMQELAGAYYKVYKYNKPFFGKLVNGANKTMDLQKASQSRSKLWEWLTTFGDLNGIVPLSLTKFNSLEQMRKQHNKVYQEMVAEMSKQGGFKATLLGNLAKALIYAAEAYHTRGAIRHVVGGTQLEVISIGPKITSLSTHDLWVSMIENWGESNKEYDHCKSDPLEKCFLKMSKYMWRMFNAMRFVRDRIPVKDRPGLVHFGEAYSDPEFAMKMWLDYKRKGAVVIPKYKNHVKEFLRQFHCNAPVFGRPFSPDCISKMNDKVNDYNVKLAKLVTDQSDRPLWKNY